MFFKRYTSIENSYREKFVASCEYAISSGHCEDDFVVEEKAHGANFSFYHDGVELKTASRSDFLTDDGMKFNQSHVLKRNMAPKIQTLRTLIGEGDRTIRVAGEIIGGRYKNPDLPYRCGVPLIQKGVEYCPGHEFYAFDLYVWKESDTSNPKDGAYKLMDRIEANALFGEANMLYAKPLMRGSLKECLEYPNTFKSHIPGWLGLPEHPDDNIAEGKGIQPVRYARLGNGKRLILKDKAAAFMEVAPGQGSREQVVKTQKLPPGSKVKSAEGQELMGILLAHVTDNRLDNVLSKLPKRPTKKETGQVCGMLCKDALDDFHKDHGDEYAKLKPKEQKEIQKVFGRRAMEIVSNNLK